MHTQQKIEVHRANATVYAKLLLCVSLTLTINTFADTKLLNETTDGSYLTGKKSLIRSS
jgi:phosphosulfolactate phosphohydrolase-like enzyme